MLLGSIHSKVGKKQGCFGSSVERSLADRVELEAINEFVYMRYCPTERWPDMSTQWKLRAGIYTESMSTFTDPISNFGDETNGLDKDWLGRRAKRGRGALHSKTEIVNSQVFRFENGIDVEGEEMSFCVIRLSKGILKLTECGPMTPTIAQWFEIIEEDEAWGW